MRTDRFSSGYLKQVIAQTIPLSAQGFGYGAKCRALPGLALQVLDRGVSESDGECRGLESTRHGPHPSGHDILRWTGQDPMAGNLSVFEPDRTCLTRRDTNQFQRWLDDHSRQVARYGEQDLARVIERGACHDPIGEGGTSHPRAVAVEHHE